MSAEQRLKELGLTLPQVPEAMGNYVHHVRTGNLLYLSGKGPMYEDGTFSTGKVGADVSLDQAYADARLTGMFLLAVAKDALGSLDKIRRVVKVLGMVNCGPGFGDHPRVINGCSDLLVEILGEKGRHARSAVGMSSLPLDTTVEIEVIFEVE